MTASERRKCDSESSGKNETNADQSKKQEVDTESQKLFWNQEILPPETTELTLHSGTTNNLNLNQLLLMGLAVIAWELFVAPHVENSTDTAEKSKKKRRD